MSRNRPKKDLAGGGTTQQMEPGTFVSERDRQLVANDQPAEKKLAHGAATRRMEPEEVASVRERAPAGLVEPVERELPGAGAHRQGGRGITLPMPGEDA
jgi:hypothetical protein